MEAVPNAKIQSKTNVIDAKFSEWFPMQPPSASGERKRTSFERDDRLHPKKIFIAPRFIAFEKDSLCYHCFVAERAADGVRALVDIRLFGRMTFIVPQLLLLFTPLAQQNN